MLIIYNIRFYYEVILLINFLHTKCLSFLNKKRPPSYI
ncbi:hypothetical protein S100390_v1c09500 [Spiroplasma sp. NBRC 100390]|nr:hypothetical protein STU14_v1c09500 [Spiroplasma sp. TU-14]APE13756.1 hypothetical protein S100390_v1c09500 [Spiroplasma sp. NBRC 100390]